MKFQEPEVVEMGSAGELIEITMFESKREDPMQQEPTWSGPVYLGEE